MSSKLMRAVAGFAVAGLLAGCSGGGTEAAEAPSATPEAVETVAPTETEAPSPEPTERDILADPENDAREPEDGLVGILRFRDALFTEPDPDKLTLAYAEDCTCWEPLFSTMSRLAESGQRASFETERVIVIEEVEERTGPLAVVRYQSDSPPGVILDDSGDVIETSPGNDQLQTYRATIVLRAGRWILIDDSKVDG